MLNGHESAETGHTLGRADEVGLPDGAEPRAQTEAPVQPQVPELAEASVQPEEPVQSGARADGPAGPRLVRRVVCSYRLGWLSSDWLQTWRRLDGLFASGGLDVKATLAPLEDLPRDTDILVVPPELREAAREAALPNTPILVTPASVAAGAFADLVGRLEAGTEFTAERRRVES